jgi:hypothetical protein
VRPELPYLAAGSIAIAGGMAREKSWPKSGARAVIATVVLVIVASATAETALAPLVRAIGLLAVLGAIMSATPVVTKARRKKG